MEHYAIPEPVALDEHTPENPMYPEITVKLTGQDGNIFNLMGIAVKAMKKSKIVHEDDIDDMWEALQRSPNYVSALSVISSYVVVV